MSFLLALIGLFSWILVIPCIQWNMKIEAIIAIVLGFAYLFTSIWWNKRFK